MAIIVELPRLSDTMEEGVIAKWRVNVGDKVKRGQVIADIETDKATMEFESFDAGTVLELIAPEGETLALGAPIAVLGAPGEDPKAALEGRGGAAAKKKADGSKKDEARKGKKEQAEEEAEVDDEVEDEEAAKPRPSSAPTEIPRTAPAKAKAPAPKPAPAQAEAPRDGDRRPASPLARKLAREHGLSLDQIEGSGPRGRIVKTDVLAAAEGRVEGRAGTTEAGFVTRPDTPMKLSQMRKAIARRMAQANAEIPHFYLRIVVDMTQSVALRQQLGEALPDVKISFNDIVVFAVARALAKHPEVNAYWDGETIVRRGDIHVGIAVALDDGLIVPVVKHADQKSLSAIAVDARDLGTRAKEKKLAPEEMVGSTFTVSNLGMFGVEEFSAVINPGEGAILAVGAIVDEPVVVGGEVAVRKRMRMTMACDHRVMDGAGGARFMATLRGLLEKPLAMLA